MPTTTLPSSCDQALRSESDAVSSRIRALQETEIDFIPNSSFSAGNCREGQIVEATLQQSVNAPAALAGLPAHLRRMCESDLLTHEQEMALFREMNYLKFQANELRAELDLEQDDLQAALAVESLLAKAQTFRDYLVKANTRLVMSIVKKYVTPQNSFDDLLSEGIFTLMKAVEKFDFDRGFRFSTYAYRSVARSVYQAVAHARQEEARFTRDAEEWAFEDVDERSASSMSEQVWSSLRELTASLLKQLDRRERFIIRSRYALGAHRKVRTFQYLADKLGVSKERVRQLEQRAVAKLQAISQEYDIDELSGAAML